MPESQSSSKVCSGVLFESDIQPNDSQELQKLTPRKIELIWTNIIVLSVAHISAIYGFYLIFTSAHLYTTAFALLLYILSGTGIIAGAHRLWSHRSYKATRKLEILLMIMSTISYQNCVIHWAREHRAHHKFSETDADHVNSRRGFFFSHIGWLFCRKHPDVARKGAGIDISDLTTNPVLLFQKRYYALLMPILCFLLPTAMPVLLWNDTWSNAWFVATMFRWVMNLNATWLISSAAHAFGTRPYDRHLSPTNNFAVGLLTFGAEGCHNYHHVFPWDYRASEIGLELSPNTMFIKFCERIGWAYDLRTVPNDLVESRVKRTGDGSHSFWNNVMEKTADKYGL